MSHHDHRGFAYALGVYTRSEIATVLKEAGRTGAGVEIGTHRGKFAAAILDRWPGTLYCVDPWDNPPGYADQAKLLEHSSGDRQADYNEAKAKLSQFGQRAVLVRKTSREALWDEDIPNILDFVYIDGDHRREEFSADLRKWYRRVRVNGVVAGHDWLCPGPEHSWGLNIQPEVEQLAKDRGLTVYLVAEPEGLPWSFYMFKR